jgi:hypothetical protein
VCAAVPKAARYASAALAASFERRYQLRTCRSRLLQKDRIIRPVPRRLAYAEQIPSGLKRRQVGAQANDGISAQAFRCASCFQERLIDFTKDLNLVNACFRTNW